MSTKNCFNCSLNIKESVTTTSFCSFVLFMYNKYRISSFSPLIWHGTCFLSWRPFRPMCDSRQNQESSDLGMAESLQWHTHIQDVLEQVARFESLSTLVFPGAGGIFTHTHTHTHTHTISLYYKPRALRLQPKFQKIPSSQF